MLNCCQSYAHVNTTTPTQLLPVLLPRNGAHERGSGDV